MISGITFTGKLYTAMKWVTLILLPACSSLYFGLSQIYGWPNGEQVVGTIALVTTFLGLLLGISTKNYNTSDAKYDGVIVMNQDPETGKFIYSLDLNDDVETLNDKTDITFKMVQPTS